MTEIPQLVLLKFLHHLYLLFSWCRNLVNNLHINLYRSTILGYISPGTTIWKVLHNFCMSIDFLGKGGFAYAAHSYYENHAVALVSSDQLLH